MSVASVFGSQFPLNWMCFIVNLHLGLCSGQRRTFQSCFFFLLLPPHSFSSTEVAALPRLSPTASYPSLIFHFYLNIDFILPVAAPTVFPQLREQRKGHPLNPGQDYSGWVHTLPALLSTQTNKTTSPGIDQHIMHGHCKCIRVISNSS